MRGAELGGSPLFTGMDEGEISRCLKDSGARLVSYEKDEMVFCQGDTPRELTLLAEGAVNICSDSSLGKRSLAALIDRPGELFGEVFVFLGHKEYEYYAQAAAASRVLHIPKEYLFLPFGAADACHGKLLSNLLAIFAGKAYYLNQRLQIISCSSLRQKIARALLFSMDHGGAAATMNREELADFLNAARPSLSRELMRMQREGILQAGRRGIVVEDAERLRGIL